MQYRESGVSGLNVSGICMGCMGFGEAGNGQHTWTIDEEHSREIIRRGLELGVNFFDTAIGYQSGTSEQYLGRALRDYARLKYDAAAEQDGAIIRRVALLAEKRGVSMTEISLAWLMTKVTSPIVGATKLHHVEGAAKAVELKLSEEEISYLEELYIPHKLVGVMAQNTQDTAKESHVWSAGNQKI